MCGALRGGGKAPIIIIDDVDCGAGGAAGGGSGGCVRGTIAVVEEANKSKGFEADLVT